MRVSFTHLAVQFPILHVGDDRGQIMLENQFDLTIPNARAGSGFLVLTVVERAHGLIAIACNIQAERDGHAALGDGCGPSPFQTLGGSGCRQSSQTECGG
jgi:hypothetical protein